MDDELLVATEEISAPIMSDLEPTERISAPGIQLLGMTDMGMSGLIGICLPELTDAILAPTNCQHIGVPKLQS